MVFRKHEIGFREADRRYAELKGQHEAGSISDEEFDAQLKQMMVQDDEDRWWSKSRNTGEWHYHDGSTWVRGTPPIYQQPRTLPGEESTPDRQPWPEQGDEWLPPSQTSLLGGTATQEQDGGEQGRRVPRWAIIAAGFVGVVVLAGIGITTTMVGEESGSAPGYDLVRHENLSVEVPSEWEEHIVADSEGEKGRNWSEFLGENAGPSVTAVNGLDAWRNGTRGHQGVYLVASKRLAQEYTDDELVASGPNDYSASCEAGTRQDFDRPPYSGRIQRWENCGGESGHTAIALAAAPEGRECVIVGQIGGYFQQADEEKIQHVLDTVEADCGEI
jgi:hypothetical protein